MFMIFFLSISNGLIFFSNTEIVDEYSFSSFSYLPFSFLLRKIIHTPKTDKTDKKNSRNKIFHKYTSGRYKKRGPRKEVLNKADLRPRDTYKDISRVI